MQDPGDTPSVARTSPLYCRYNGFLLGQFLSLAFAACGAPRYGERRGRLLEFLREVDVDVAIPESPLDRGGVTYAGVLSAILPRLAQRSRELAEFAILGGLLTHYGVASRTDAEAAAAMLIEIERLRAVYDLPPIDPARFAVPAHEADPDRVLAPSLGYLRDIVARLPVEGDTAFVVMPFTAPYAGYYASFYRPALEHCGYRAFRAWGGLAGAEHADLLLALIGQGRPDLGRRLGARSRRRLPDRRCAGARQAGRDRGVRGSRRRRARPHRPRSGRPLRSARRGLAARHGAADVGVPGGDHAGGGARRRLRVTPNSIEGVFDEVSQALGRILLPREAREAQRRGRRAMDAGDLVVAEASFDEACRLGLHDEETKLWRGWARLGLGRFEEAAADLGAVLGRDPLEPPAGEWRPIAAYLRAVLREAQGDLAGALGDFELAVALGLTDADVRDKRDALAARVGS